MPNTEQSIEALDEIPEVSMEMEVCGMVQQPTDKTLSIADMPADAKRTGEVVADLAADIADSQEDITELQTGKIDEPTTPGTDGQVLTSDGEGGASWEDPVQPDPEMIATAVDAWLDEHPEATTTVEDGAITRAKLDNTLKAYTDRIPNIGSVENISGNKYRISFG